MLFPRSISNTINELITKRNNIWRVLLSVIFSFMALWGYQINGMDSINYGKHPILFFVLTALFFLLILVIDILMSVIEKSKGFIITNRFMYISGAIIIAVWIVVWLSVFPGLAIYDGPSQLAQWHAGNISTHHPYIHSAFLRLCELMSEKTGIEDYSFFNAFIQLIFQFICYMRLLYVMRDLKIKSVYMVYLVFFMAFFPPNAFIALTTTKDAIFIGFFILMMCELVGLIKKTPEEIKTKDIVRLIIFASFMCIFRKNGIYAFIVGFPFLLIISFKKLWKKLAIVYFSVLIVSLLYSGFVSNVLMIRSGDSREALSLIIQPLSRIYNSVPAQLSLEETERIRKLFSGNENIEYVSYCSDYSKFIFDTEYFKSDIKENLKLYFNLMKRYPTAYMDAFLATNLGNYYPLESLPRKLKVYYEIPVTDSGHSLIPGLYDVIADFAWNSSYSNSTILTIWLNSGTTLWKLLYVIYFMIRRKEYKRLTLCSLPFMLMGTMLMAAGTVIRYTQPITITIPLLLVMAMYDYKEEGTTNERVTIS